MPQYNRLLLVPTPASVAPAGAIPNRVALDAAVHYGVLHPSAGRLYRDLAVAHLMAAEVRTMILAAAASAAPAATLNREQINPTPAYGTWTGENSGRLNFDLYGVYRLDLGYITGQVAIQCSTTLEIAANMLWGTAAANLDGTTALAILGTRVHGGAATMAGTCVLALVGTRVLCGVVQMDGHTTLRIMVTANGVSLSCYTGDGEPVVPESSSPLSKNYVF